jgi:transposase
MNGSTGRWVGIDVAKSKLDVALLDERGKVKNHVFANDAKGHLALTEWLSQRGCSPEHTRVCMEATGCYSETVATALADADWKVSVVNPARVKGFAQGELLRNKTDRADAALLARFGQAMQPEPWVAPPLEVRQLRALVDRLQSLKEMHQQEANRLEAAMNQVGMRESIESHMTWLQASIKQLERQIEDHIDGHPGLREDARLITSIPGVGNTTAAKVMAYLGDTRRFKNAKALAAFIGVTPRLKLSGSSVRGRSMISRSGHAEIRRSLYMPALVALKHNPIIKTFGERLKAGGLAPKAVVAASMHKLVHLIYGILKSGRPFNPNFLVASLDMQDGI